MVKGSLVRVLKYPPFFKIRFTQEAISISRIKFLAPQEATKIILVGLNYKDHARELKMGIPKEPILFLKPSSSLLPHEGRIIYPRGVKRLDYEAELAMVIKKKGKNIPKKEVKDYILGYACLNDITARDLQKKDIQWTRAKSFDSFCPLGPWVETEIKPSNLQIRTYINGKIRQDSFTSNFIFGIDHLISFISGVMTLFPGDVISTGTPPGIGSIKPGDTVEVEIEGIGKLKSFVAR